MLARHSRCPVSDDTSRRLASCEQAIALRPDQASAHLLCAGVLRALDRRDAAVTSYDRAIAIDQGNAEAHCNRGATLLLLHKIHEAMASFDRAIAIKPDYAEAYFHRGYSHRMLNRFDSAAADLQESLRHCHRISSFFRALALKRICMSATGVTLGPSSDRSLPVSRKMRTCRIP